MKNTSLKNVLKFPGINKYWILFGGKKSWICGRTLEGCPCEVGPDSKGKCQSFFECTPYFDGNRWVCDRAETLGGVCTEGPSPEGECCRPRAACVPIKAFSQRVRISIIWVSALTLSVILLSLFTRAQDYIISPGPLSAHHAPIPDCISCHQDPQDGGLFGLFASAFLSESSIGLNKQCLVCHDYRANSAARPHTMPAQKLRKVTEAAQKKLLEARSSFPKKNIITFNAHVPEKGIACIVCHKEHKGNEFDITAVSLGQCNACHVRKVFSFETNHPEFKMYPHERRTQIIYNHESHELKHYKEEENKDRAPESCATCHITNIQGGSTELAGYEAMCASCHDADIKSKTKSGLPVLSIPNLDLDELMEKNKMIGQWPVATDSDITPFMRVLLASDRRYISFRILQKEQGVDLRDLRGETPEVLDAVEDLAWAIKDLFYDLEDLGSVAIEERLKGVVNDPALIGAAFNALSSDMPVDAFRVAQQHWFPGLIEEVEAYRTGSISQTRKVTPKGELDVVEEEEGESFGPDGDISDWLESEDDPDAEEDEVPEKKRLGASEWMRHGGWFFDVDALKYRPHGHEDEFITAWTNLTDGRAVQAGKLFEASTLFSYLMLEEKFSPGACNKCHSIDRAGQSYTVNWRKSRRGVADNMFTKFSHKEHVEITGKEMCDSCHVLKSNSAYDTGYKDLDPKTFDSNYRQIKKDVCTTCHKKDGADNRCQTCHNYHVGAPIGDDAALPAFGPSRPPASGIKN